MKALALMLALASCSGRPPVAPTPPIDAIAQAHAADRRGDLDAARTVLERALADARAAQNRAAVVMISAELARAASRDAFTRQRGYEAGVILARDAQQAARAANDPRSLAIALDSEGMLHYSHMLWDGAKDFAGPRAQFQAAAAAYRAASDLSGLSETAFHIGLSYELAGDLTAAAPHYQDAHRFATEARDDVMLSYTERHLASLAESRGDLATARRGYERSLALREQTGYVRLVPYALLALADLDLREHATAPALERYRRALAIAEQLDHEPTLVWAHLGLGEGLRATGDRAGASQHFDRAQAFAERAKIAIGIAAVASARAELAKASP